MLTTANYQIFNEGSCSKHKLQTSNTLVRVDASVFMLKKVLMSKHTFIVLILILSINVKSQFHIPW